MVYLFTLKHVTRWHHPRSPHDVTESVAEHVYGLHVLAEYFLPLEQTHSSLSPTAVNTIINFHDVEEIITQDKLGYLKTAADRTREQEAIVAVLNKLSGTLYDRVHKAAAAYQNQISLEAKFVKALDKIK